MKYYTVSIIIIFPLLKYDVRNSDTVGSYNVQGNISREDDIRLVTVQVILLTFIIIVIIIINVVEKNVPVLKQTEV